MDIAILDYTTCEVIILRNVDPQMIEVKYEDNVELYLESEGYNMNQIHYMCGDEINVTEH